jgi:hypothetical protein
MLTCYRSQTSHEKHDKVKETCQGKYNKTGKLLMANMMK